MNAVLEGSEPVGVDRWAVVIEGLWSWPMRSSPAAPKAFPCALALLGLLVGACTSPVSTPPPETAPPPPPSSTTAPDVALAAVRTTVPEPTTTAPVFRLDGGNPAWEKAVADVYGSACGGERSSLPFELAGLGEPRACPVGGVATIAPMGGGQLAAAAIGTDAIYGVDEGTGFRIVAARLGSRAWEVGLAWYGTVPKTVVAVGSDARPGEDPLASRADSIHVVALDGAGQGGVLGIPRDSWVRIAGGGMSKINASLATGGPGVMLQTIADVTGLNLDGYVLTGFTGFQEMLGKVLGGVDIELPYSVIDSAAGADLGSGPQYLNGPEALALARARKSLAGGDLARQLNGGLLLLAALSSAQAYGPLHLPTLISAGSQWMSTDLSPAELLAFSALALDTPVAGIGNRVAPGRIGTAGRASVVYLTDSAPEFYVDLADGSLNP